MPGGKPERSSALEGTVRSSINALWQELVSNRGESSSVDVHKELHVLVNSAVQSLGARANARLLVNQLPTELFAYIASYLGPRDLFRAALGCSTWRAILLGMPRLWARICISLRHCTARTVAQSAALLETMLARSQDLPLCIEFQCLALADDDADSDVRAYGRIPALIAAQMPRVRSLSLLVPRVEHTPLDQVITTPAPALTRFVFYVLGEEFESLPESLFAGHAPCLTSLTLRMVNLHSNVSYPAVHSVEDFIYDARLIYMSDIITIAQEFPALRALTLVGDECDLEHLTTTCAQSVALRLPCVRGIPDVIDKFPNATSVCLSASAGCSADALDVAFRAAEPLTALEVDYRGKHWIGPWNAQPRVLALTLNGRAAVVDLAPRHADKVRMLAARCAGVRRLTVCEEFWPLFAAAPLPALRELTVRILPAGPRKHGGPLVWHAEDLIGPPPGPLPLTLLRLVAPPDSGMQGLEEAVVARVVRALADRAALRTLVLCGTALVAQPGEGILRELVPHLEIVFEEFPEIEESPPWFWTFPADDAIHI